LEIERDDLLQAAGRKADRERNVRSQDARDALTLAIIGLGTSSGVAIAAATEDLDPFAGAGLAAVGATAAASLVTVAVALRTLRLAASRRRRSVGDSPLPPNVGRLAQELTDGRRAALELRHVGRPETTDDR